MMKKRFNRFSLFTILLSILLLSGLLGGCGKRSTETNDPAKSEELIADVVEIPSDGIITADQFNAFAGTSRTISFTGSSDGIDYVWDYNGRNIHNAMDMDLSIDFITDEASLAPIKEAANHAPYALGMVLKGTGTITVPTLTITYPEAWDADTAVFCKNLDGSIYRMADANITVDPDKNTTTLSMKIMEVGDSYYIVAGSSTGPAVKESESSAEESVSESVTESPKEETPSSQADQNNAQTTAQKPQESKAPEATQTITVIQTEKTKEETKPAKKSLTCTICINCSTILSNMDKLDDDRVEFVPSDGWILLPTEVEFTEGDSVLDILKAVCRAYKIPMEHNGSYVEGINQLYEFNCGELSGWMYSVDGWFPNYGADSYIVSDGETIRWSYTCDLGKDVGDNSKW